jgi:hypothetical protein
MTKVKLYELSAVILNIPAVVLVAMNYSQFLVWLGFVVWTIGAIPLYLWNKEKGGKSMLLLPIIYFIIDGIGIVRWWPF